MNEGYGVEDNAPESSENGDPDDLDRSLTEVYTHRDFRLGKETCPECGGTNLLREERSSLDMSATEADDVLTEEVVSVQCADCDEILYEHPSGRLEDFIGDSG